MGNILFAKCHSRDNTGKTIFPEFLFGDKSPFAILSQQKVEEEEVKPLAIVAAVPGADLLGLQLAQSGFRPACLVYQNTV